MKTSLAASEWAAGRGDKWCAHLARMEATLLPVNEPLIDALQLATATRIADIGCGGGGTALEIARRAPRGAIVHGFDISPSLIEAARTRAATSEPPVAFEVADVGSATPDTPYDRLVSRFGVMFFDDPRAAFSHLVHWLQPGGRFAFAVWGPVSENAMMTSVRELVARIVAIPQPDPDAPGPYRYADAGKLVSLLHAAGFTEVEVRDWRGALPLGGGLPPAEAAQFALSSFANFAELLDQAGDGALDEAHRAVTSCLSDYQKHGAVWMGACVRIVSGLRPTNGSRSSDPH